MIPYHHLKHRHGLCVWNKSCLVCLVIPRLQNMTIRFCLPIGFSKVRIYFFYVYFKASGTFYLVIITWKIRAKCLLWLRVNRKGIFFFHLFKYLNNVSVFYIKVQDVKMRELQSSGLWWNQNEMMH